MVEVIWNTFESRREQLAKQYTQSVWSGGATEHELREGCRRICAETENMPRILTKARIFEYIMNNAAVEVNPLEMFADKINHCDIIGELRDEWLREAENGEMEALLAENERQQARRLYTADADFSHTCPDWDRILSLGICGIAEDMEERSKAAGLTEKQSCFYKACNIVCRSVIAFMKRLAGAAAEIGTDNTALIAQNLESLCTAPPKTLHEAMQLAFILYYLQTFVEKVNVRSLGGLDRLYYRFYKADIESGRLDDGKARELIRYFLFRLYALGAVSNSPFYLCGTDRDGKTVINELSYIIIEEYNALSVHDPKIHIRFTPDLPEDFLKAVLKTIAGGNNSILFMNDRIAIKALEKLGESTEDARNYVPVGCYEPCSMGREVPCSCNGRINLPKAVELAVNNGEDIVTGELLGVHDSAPIRSFDDFYSAVKRQLAFMVENTMKIINGYERSYPRINPAPLFSSLMPDCAESGTDAYEGGARYNNSSINSFGLACAVDSVIVVKKAVFEEKIVTQAELAEILKSNWTLNQKLRLRCKNKYPKYGNNCAEADEIAADITAYVAGLINGRPNGRGGVYRSGLFSIDWYTDFGRTTSATPDGREEGAPLSKNTSAVTGCDKNGVTSLINSATRLDYTICPNGTVLDLILHTSAVKGSEGIAALLGIVRAYMQKGGIALQFNILNPELLKRAQTDPERYATLQIRLCGWNVFFVNLSREEQDAFITMSEHAAETQ